MTQDSARTYFPWRRSKIKTIPIKEYNATQQRCVDKTSKKYTRTFEGVTEFNHKTQKVIKALSLSIRTKSTLVTYSREDNRPLEFFKGDLFPLNHTKIEISIKGKPSETITGFAPGKKMCDLATNKVYERNDW